jgi:hypothetical protein
VLQLDPSPHYGGSWASLRLSELRSLLQSLSPSNAASEGRQARQAAASGIVDGEIWQQQPEADLGPDAQYSIDLAPKVWYRTGTPTLLQAQTQRQAASAAAAKFVDVKSCCFDEPWLIQCRPGGLRRGTTDPAAAGQRGAPLSRVQAGAGQVGAADQCSHAFTAVL